MNSSSTQRVLERAEKHCLRHGARLTQKRRAVLQGLLRSDRALSAYELADTCRAELGVELLPMSVYRILAFLESKHLVHRLDLANKYVACSHIACEHEHSVPQFLICKVCHRVKEIGLPRRVLDSVSELIEDAGYQLAGQQLELDCLCGPCASSAKELS